MSDLYECSKCHKPKPSKEFHEAHRPDRDRLVTSQCKECRSESYFSKRYPDNVCIQCLKHKRILNKNKTCKTCNNDNGLRECSACKEMLPALLSFYGNKIVCKTCINAD